MARLGVGAAVIDGELVRGDVHIDVERGVIDAVGVGDGTGDLIATPGFVDLQVNGLAGVHLADADVDGYRTVAAALLAAGVTAYQPTFVTQPLASFVRALEHLASLPDEVSAAPRIIGAHLEGPFLSPARLGAHPPAHRLDPHGDTARRLLAAGPVHHVTLAPELPGAHDVIDLLLAAGVTVSAGHSDATAQQAHDAFDRGVRTVTHLFNAMRAPSHRDPGIAYVAMSRADVVVQAIVDGLHLAPDTALLAWRATGPGRFALVSDVVGATPGPDGAVRLADGTLAGSALVLDQAVRNLVALGVAPTAAIGAASTTPARIARRPDLGVLEPGGLADVVVLDADLHVRRTLVAGVERYAA